jgi:choline dehydrogenase-like flavoprotein
MRRRAIPLCAVLALALAGCKPPGRASVDRELAAFLPAGSVALAGLRVDEVKGTPAGAKLAALLEPAGVEAHDLLVSWDGKDWLFAARGRLRAPATQTLTAVGDTVLAGSAEALRSAIAQHAAGRPGPNALLDCARDSAGQGQFWAVSNGAPLIPRTARYASVERLLNAIEDIRFSVDLRDGIQAAASGNCLNNENAAIIDGSLRAMLSLGRLNVARRDPDLLRAYNGIRVEQHGRAVRLTAAIPRDAADKLIARLSN